MKDMHDYWDQAYELGRANALKQAADAVTEKFGCDCEYTTKAVEAIQGLSAQSS